MNLWHKSLWVQGPVGANTPVYKALWSYGDKNSHDRERHTWGDVDFSYQSRLHLIFQMSQCGRGGGGDTEKVLYIFCGKLHLYTVL